MELKTQNIEEARAEATLHYLRGKLPGVLRQRYEDAVVAENVEEAAEAARAYRNALLDESDSMMVSDRPNVNEQEWRTYRQELRDIPLQEGFPLNIEFPVKPE